MAEELGDDALFQQTYIVVFRERFFIFFKAEGDAVDLKDVYPIMTDYVTKMIKIFCLQQAERCRMDSGLGGHIAARGMNDRALDICQTGDFALQTVQQDRLKVDNPIGGFGPGRFQDRQQVFITVKKVRFRIR